MRREIKVFVSDFFSEAEKIREKAMLYKHLDIEINTLMNELPLNDCGLPGNEYGSDPYGTRITLTDGRWQLIRTDKDHPLHQQATQWPRTSSCGLLTSRMETDWNEEHTCSGDLMYIGAVPVGVWKSIMRYCQDAMKQMERREDREHMKNICKNLKEKWKVIEKFARVKPEIIQRSIAAQLDIYKDTLKKRHEASEEKVLLQEEDVDSCSG